MIFAVLIPKEVLVGRTLQILLLVYHLESELDLAPPSKNCSKYWHNTNLWSVSYKMKDYLYLPANPLFLYDNDKDFLTTGFAAHDSLVSTKLL